MKKLLKSVLIWYTPEEMYRLVTDVDQYMHFLPWCNHSKVLHFSALEMDAEVGIGLAGMSQVFVTHNTHIENHEVRMKLVKGPFSNLDGTWTFDPVETIRRGLAKSLCRLSMVFLVPPWLQWLGPFLTKLPPVW